MKRIVKKLNLDNGKVTCPFCKGDGCIPTPRLRLIDDKKFMIVTLRAAGYSIREIAKKLGYKAHSQVQAILK